MIFLGIFVGLVLLLTLLPTMMFIGNLRLYTVATSAADAIDKARTESISVLIPARNEAAGIATTLDHILRSSHPNFEVLILDDHSEDETASIVNRYAERDPRVRLLHSAPLPSGWNGKQHACWQLAQHASTPWLFFLDADVHLTEDAMTRALAQMLSRPVSLLSGFPKQVTGTFSEKMLIPMMHVVLLGYLPLERMRASTDPGFAAGCGQLFLAAREDYFRCGGHKEIYSSRHDGIKLPRLFRKNGLKTDLFDATDICSCRMYRGYRQVTQGLLKNASEGIANRTLIIPFTLLLGGAFVLPLVLAIVSLVYSWPTWLTTIFGLMVGLSILPRLLAAVRFQQSWIGVVLHPLSVAWFLVLQWRALVRSMQGKQVLWRGRA